MQPYKLKGLEIFQSNFSHSPVSPENHLSDCLCKKSKTLPLGISAPNHKANCPLTPYTGPVRQASRRTSPTGVTVPSPAEGATGPRTSRRENQEAKTLERYNPPVGIPQPWDLRGYPGIHPPSSRCPCTLPHQAIQDPQIKTQNYKIISKFRA